MFQCVYDVFMGYLCRLDSIIRTA